MAIRRRAVPAFAVSLASHVAIVAVLWLAMRAGSRPAGPAAVAPDAAIPRMVWLPESGPGGGGGGGGDHEKDPPRQAKLPGRDTVTVPASRPRAPDASRLTPNEQEPVPHLIIPVATLASASELLPAAGAVEAPPSLPTASQGPGTGGGAGTGDGPGDGPGRGPGFGPGRDGGMDGGAYRPGNGVTMPIEIRKGTPRYTADAMRARIQGSITVECVVRPDGACTNIHVTRSFDPAFGLEEEAIKAAAQWRFRPGTRRGEPVPVLVTMEIAFALR